MLAVPETLLEQYKQLLGTKGVSESCYDDYAKWLRRFLELKTTMIYTHCVPVRTVKEPKSPLDLWLK